MNTRRILLALPFFVVFALVPVVHLGDKGWALVGMAYPGFIVLLLDGHFTDSKTLIFLGFCAVVIAAHLSLSLGLATLIDKRFFKTKS
jgi:hypothetical protein